MKKPEKAEIRKRVGLSSKIWYEPALYIAGTSYAERARGVDGRGGEAQGGGSGAGGEGLRTRVRM
eukprot:scaffold2441_cov121-Isochrysis_galbana.AAC.7